MTKNRLYTAALGTMLLVGGLAVAQPQRNVSGARHPNLAAAQRLSQQAYEKITAAQQANSRGVKYHHHGGQHDPSTEHCCAAD